MSHNGQNTRMDGHVLFPWFPVKKKNVTPCAKQDTLLLVVLMREKRLAITTFHFLQIPKEKQLCVVGSDGKPRPPPLLPHRPGGPAPPRPHSQGSGAAAGLALRSLA